MLSLGFIVIPILQMRGLRPERLHSDHPQSLYSVLSRASGPSPPLSSHVCQRRFKSFSINLESKAGIGLCCHCQIKPLWLFLMLSAWERCGFSFCLLFKQKQNCSRPSGSGRFAAAFRWYKLPSDLSPYIAASLCFTSSP